MEEWECNLLNTDKSMLVGDLGEAITLHYLTEHDFLIVTRPIRFRVHGEIILISAHYQKQRENYAHLLTEKQREYLNNFPTWDYVAFKRKGEKDWTKPHLVEVKTIREERRPHKKPESNGVSKAKALEFKPVLVTVRLLENWGTFVEASEF